MRSRWFHTPTVHAPPHGETKAVSWLELFYDLIFVAAIIQLGDFLSHDVSLAGFGRFVGHFVPLWIAWTGFTFYQNRFNVDDFLHRTLVLIKMFAVGTMAIWSHAAMQGNPAPFAAAYAVAQGILVLLHVRSWVQEPSSRDYSLYWGGVFAVGAVTFAVSTLLPTPWCYVLWAVGIAAILTAPMAPAMRSLTERFPIDMEHLSERYGLLTIIVLGESFVKVLTYLTGLEHGASPEYLLKGFFNLALTCSIWWVYFDDVAGAEIKKDRFSFVVWLFSHIPVTLAITAVGVAVKKAIGFELMAVAPEQYRWLLAGSLALTFLSVAMIDLVTERPNQELNERNRVMSRVFSAVLLLLLAQVGGSMTAATFLGLVSALCGAQVLLDMMMAPFEDVQEEMHQARSTADLARDLFDADTDTPREKPRVDVTQAVRKGAPAELRRDLYFFFIEGSWTRLVLSFGFVYTFLNVGFAALYQLEPGSIAGAPDQSFGDAFFFSVQTLASLGYGALTPASNWANMLVTVEAATGMLFAALATGLMFAKAARPTSSVLWADKVVISHRHGVPTLMLRLANARGNEVVDAAMSVTALIEEISPEGHHMRRLHDLRLVRKTTPIFALSWLVMHEIDADSALHEVDWDKVLAIFVTMTGHDGTYGQTTYSRHLYEHGDIRWDHRYVDVIHQMPDGRLMIDLDRFHDTTPEDAGEE